MKKLLFLTLAGLLSVGLHAQEEDLMESIYKDYSGDKMSLQLNLDTDFLKDFDLDLDTDDVRQVIKGDIDRLRFIRFEDFRPALRSQKEIIERLFKAGYEYVSVEDKWDVDEESQVLIFKKAGVDRSPNLIIMINDRDDQEALVLILSGDIIFKSEAL